MPEGNGQQDNLSRLDRFEREMAFIIDEHEAFRAEHKFLLRAQVMQQGALSELRQDPDHLSDKIDFVVDGIQRDNQDLSERLKRFEEKL